MQLDLFNGLKEDVKEGIICIKCNTLKPYDSFSNASGGNYKNTTCKKCTNKHAKIIKELKSTTAPPAADHVCPICLRSADMLVCPTKPDKTVWSLDHDHETHEFRGWLCHRCNRGVGLIGDTVENAERVLKYLKGDK